MPDDAEVAARLNVAINAWTGNDCDTTGSLAANTSPWAMRRPPAAMTSLAAHKADIRDWKDPTIGWGVVIADRPDRSAKDNAQLKDLPPALQELVKFRQGAIFGWSKADGVTTLTRYLEDGTLPKIPIGDIARGTASNALPRYMLIFGSPEQIPWAVQYTLGLCAAVGRLDLDDEGLENYVNAVTTNWSTSGLDVARSLLWSVDKGGSDITTLMKTTVADPLFKKLTDDPQIGDQASFLTGADALHDNLLGALAARKPALIVTTSHGRTGPLNDPDAIRRDLGLMVDRAGATLPLGRMLQQWQPDGAIWYAQACCSAGSETGTIFGGLFPVGSGLALTLEAIGRLGAQSAPLPKVLLGAKRPLRAFIGHVEPTFDWTLSSPDTKSAVTASIIAALYVGLYEANPMPVGAAFKEYFEQVGQLLNQWYQARQEALNSVAADRTRPLRYQLGALDRRSLVIHGDPAVALPALK